jgi:hypothetical protein
MCDESCDRFAELLPNGLIDKWNNFDQWEAVLLLQFETSTFYFTL